MSAPHSLQVHQARPARPWSGPVPRTLVLRWQAVAEAKVWVQGRRPQPPGYGAGSCAHSPACTRASRVPSSSRLGAEGSGWGVGLEGEVGAGAVGEDTVTSPGEGCEGGGKWWGRPGLGEGAGLGRSGAQRELVAALPMGEDGRRGGEVSGTPTGRGARSGGARVSGCGQGARECLSTRRGTRPSLSCRVLWSGLTVVCPPAADQPLAPPGPCDRGSTTSMDRTPGGHFSEHGPASLGDR